VGPHQPQGGTRLWWGRADRRQALNIRLAGPDRPEPGPVRRVGGRDAESRPTLKNRAQAHRDLLPRPWGPGRAVHLGLGRIVALYSRPSTLSQIR
jgi:hypothetical protein